MALQPPQPSRPVRRHHYVPVSLIKRWRGPDGKVAAHYWDDRTMQMRVFPAAPKQLCFEYDLYRIEGFAHGEDAIERLFFKDIDDRGALALEKLRQGETPTITERHHIIQYLLALEARRPAVMTALAVKGAEFLVRRLTEDREFQEMLAQLGEEAGAVEVFERETQMSLEGHAKMLVQSLSTNSIVARTVAASEWVIIRIYPDRGPRFVLSDRPLVRINGADSPNLLWALPLDPDTAMFITPNLGIRDSIRKTNPEVLARELNRSSAHQATKYVLSVRNPEGHWLARRLAHRSKHPDPPIDPFSKKE